MSLEIAAIGDVGIYDQQVKSLAKSIPAHQISFLALLGDNFYPTGIQNGKEWDQYLKTFGHLKVPIYPILGNHDYSGDITAQLNSPYWRMPDYYYSVIYDQVGFWFIDTQIIDPGNPDDPNTYMNLWNPIQYYHGSQSIKNNCQLEWLNKSLHRHRKIPHKIVFGHYPIFTSGIHGDNLKLAQELLPILTKHRVSAYVSGHDHNNQHIQRRINNEYVFNQYITACTSHENAYPYKTKQHGSVYFSTEVAYLKITCGKQLVFRFITPQGKIIYARN